MKYFEKVSVLDENGTEIASRVSELDPLAAFFWNAASVTFCVHDWTDAHQWENSSGNHGSRTCKRCHVYEQW